MFDNQTQQKEPEDMFGGVEAAPRPPATTTDPVSGVPQMHTSSLEVSGPMFSPGKLWTTVGLVVVVLAIGAATYWWVVIRHRVEIPSSTALPPIEVVTPPPTPPVILPPIDSDLDGLSDEEEVVLKTNPALPDTDADELNDRDEVRVYGTDPVRADTDGDGFPDGVEVKNGYNPKGAGKIMNEQEDLKKLGN